MAGKSTVGDYVSLQRGTTYKGSLVGKPGPALLGLGSIRPGGGFREGDYKTYGGECPEKLMLFPGDLFVSLKGATKDGEMIGSVARVPSSVPSGRLTQDTVKLVFHDYDRETANYLYWLLRTPHYRKYCAARATGSAVVALSREDFLAYPVPSATRARKHLVELFEALEPRIELGRQTTETLESMARALFKSWFVDFDPVRAKAEGRDTTLPKSFGDLFPNALDDSEVGEIPSGWSVENIEKLAEINALTLSRTDPLEIIDYVEISEVMRGDIANIVRYERGSEPSRARRRLRHGDSVLSTVRPDRGAYFLALNPPETLIASTGFAVLTPKSGYWAFLYSLTTQREISQQLGRLADGGAYPAIRPEVVAQIPVALPATRDLIVLFERLVRPLYEKSAQTRMQSRTLGHLRDELLPKLVSGELRLPDAERMLGGQV